MSHDLSVRARNRGGLGVPLRRTGAAVLLAMAASLALAAAPKKGAPKAVPPELPAETLSDGPSLAGRTTERVYVADVAISHIVDGRLRVFDARSGQVMGMVNTGFAGNFALSPRADQIYVATTYLSRGGRGDRVDVLEVWDSQTLAFQYEVPLPPKRAQALPYRHLVSVSGNGRFVLVQNATPATSVTVVDLAGKQVVGEIQNPGCWGTMPAVGHPTRFAMLCGDGKIATVTLDDAGQVADRQLSDKLFDADTDAWFATAERIGDRFFFISFKGTITEVDLSGPVAKQTRQVSIVDATQARQGWRPGGYQAFAVRPDGRTAVVAMHDQGREGSHKLPAKQLWTVDLDTGRRLHQVTGRGSISVTFSRSGQRLQGLDGMTGALNVWDVSADGRLKLVGSVKPAGEAATMLESHD